MKEYRILAGRHDVPESVCVTFEAASDEEATVRFKTHAARPDIRWDALRLVRVDVKEVVASITSVRLR